MINEPIHITDETFEKTLTQSVLPVIVDFWAPWCTPCKMVAPLLDEIAKDYAEKLIIAKINTDENSKQAVIFGIQSIPTLLFFKDGKLTDRHSGSLTGSALREKVDQLLGN